MTFLEIKFGVKYEPDVVNEHFGLTAFP